MPRNIAKRVAFGIDLLKGRLSGAPSHCPFCGSIESRLLETRFWIMQARKCKSCRLIFRWPYVSVSEAHHFYQHAYEEDTVTQLPSPAELAALKKNNFNNTPYSASWYLGLLKHLQLPDAGRLLDFGCSWGYLSWGFARANYSVVGFEISRPRAEFGRENLKVEIYSEWPELLQKHSRDIDIIFTAHVLEHTANLPETFKHFSHAAKKGAQLVVVVPNAACTLPGYRPATTLGKEHILGFTAEWFEHNLPSLGWKLSRAFSTAPKGKILDDTSGDALVVSARCVE